MGTFTTPQDFAAVIAEGRQLDKSYPPVIVTSGALYPAMNPFMLPFTERKIFQQVLLQVSQAFKPVILHAPFQTGKTSFLLALGLQLKQNGWDVVEVDMSVVVRYIEARGNTADAFFWRMSQLIYGRSMGQQDLEDALKADQRKLCLLIDELQAIFSLPCLEDVKVFFHDLPTATVPYVAVGTFQVQKLNWSDVGRSIQRSPFNRALFYNFPSFSFEEMGQLFQLYSEKLHTSAPTAILNNIVTESSGHPASFMALLKFYDECKPDVSNWPFMFENHWREYLNGIQHKIRRSINEDQNLREELTHLTRYGMHPWEVDYSSLTRVTEDLHNIGVLCRYDSSYTRFTSTLIYRSCVDIIYGQHLTRLPLADVQDPVALLTKALHHINRDAISNAVVLNIGGPQEASFQAELYSIFRSLLPQGISCYFEARAKGQTKLDLLVTRDTVPWMGFELKVGKISIADFREPFQQASTYALHYGINIHLVNFWLQGNSVPQPGPPPHNVRVVNVMYNTTCSAFTISTLGGINSIQVD